MKFVRYFDGHIIINLLGVIIRIKHSKPYDCPEVTSLGVTKIKREATGEMTLHLVPNPDIAASLGAMKKPGQILVGFALETDHAIQHAEKKLQRKHLDFIVLNSLQDAGAGFQCDTNKISILDARERVDYPLKTKQEVAVDIVKRLAVCW